MTRSLPLTLALSALLLACGAKQPPAPAAAAPDTSSGSSAAALQPAPLSAHAEPGVEGSRPEPVSVLFSIPPEWPQQPPSSSMRLAQARIPGPGGDGELAIFHFGAGQGGGVEANLQRWIGQVETASGVEPKRESFDSNGLKVTWVDVSGTLQPSNMGSGPTTPQADSRLFGAVIEGPGGPWFVKATGPAATLAPARDSFVALLRSFHQE